MILLWDIKNKKEVKYHLIGSDINIKTILENFYQDFGVKFKQYKILNIQLWVKWQIKTKKLKKSLLSLFNQY